MTANESTSARSKPTGGDTFDTETLAQALAEAAWDAKARNVRVYDLRGIASYTDFVIICHGTSERHAHSIAHHVVGDLRPEKVRPLGIEGASAGDWILVDFGDAVLHVFEQAARADFALDALFGEPKVLATEPPEDLEDPDAYPYAN